MTYETGNPLGISHQVPGFVGNNHFNDYISGEHLARLNLALSIFDFYPVFRRYNNFKDQVLHAPVFNNFFNIYFYLVLMSGVGMHHIPLCHTVAP